MTPQLAAACESFLRATMVSQEARSPRHGHVHRVTSLGLSTSIYPAAEQPQCMARQSTIVVLVTCHSEEAGLPRMA